MKLVQNQIITVPVTSGETIYRNLFSTDKNCNYLTGIAAIEVSGDFSQDIEIEFTDDVNSIFAMSPAKNWVKNPTADNFDLTKIFRHVNCAAKGRNYYCNVKAKNTNAAVQFVVYYLQEDAISDVIPFNFQTYEFNAQGNATEYLNVVLPTEFKRVRGVAIFSNASAVLPTYFFRVVNSYKNLIDDIQMSAICVNDTTNYDGAFYLCDFNTDGQDIKLYINALDGIGAGTAFAFKVCFLLTN